MSTMSGIKSHARPGFRRVLGSVAVKLSTILLMAFAIGAVAGVSPGSGQGTFASGLLSGGLIKSAQARDKTAASPAIQLAKTGDVEQTALRWRVMSVRGTAEVREGNKMWHRWNSVKPGLLMNDRAQVRTGRDGEVIISNGHDTLTLAPDSKLELPAPGAAPSFTQVIQKSGTINYDIESRVLPGAKVDRPSLKKVLFSTQRIRGRFEVVTPFLIVGVKGTNFDVDVDARGASVDVSEGVVEVETPDQSGSATIVAGQTASVATHSGSTVIVTTSTTASAAPAATSGGGGGKSAAAPTGPAAVTTSNGSSGASASGGDGGGDISASASGGASAGFGGDGGGGASASAGGGFGGDGGGGASGGSGGDGGGGASASAGAGGDAGDAGGAIGASASAGAGASSGGENGGGVDLGAASSGAGNAGGNGGGNTGGNGGAQHSSNR